MTEPDPTLATITATFAGIDVVESRGGYTPDRPTQQNAACPAGSRRSRNQDRYELFYWSSMRGRWRTFAGDFGRLRLTLERAREVFREETMFHIQPKR